MHRHRQHAILGRLAVSLALMATLVSSGVAFATAPDGGRDAATPGQHCPIHAGDDAQLLITLLV